MNYTGNEPIIPENDLRNLEEQLKPSYQIYNIVEENLHSYDLCGFPTAGNIVDYTRHDGESGRTLNVIGIVKGKNSFLFSYFNDIEAFYRYLPTISEIVKSIVILR